MTLLHRIPFVSLLFRRNGKDAQAVIPVREPEGVAARTEIVLPSKDAPAIAVESAMVKLREFILRERGVENAKVRCTVDDKGKVHLTIGIRPAGAYKKGTSLEKLRRRVRHDMFLGTGIPKSQIDVRRNLKIQLFEELAEDPSLD